MIEFPLVNLIFISLINVLGIWLGFLIFFAAPKNKVNQLAPLWIFFTLLMINFGHFSNINYFFEYSLILKRLRFGAVSLFFIIGYFFYLHFPKKQKESLFLNKFYTIIWAILCFLSVFTPTMIQSIKLEKWGTDVIFGKGIMFYYLMTAFSIFLFLYILFTKYFDLSSQDKLKIQYFLLGVSLFALFNFVFNIVLPTILGTVKYYQIGDYSAIFLLGFIAYAIIKRELFGIKVVLTALFVGLISILLFVDVLLFTEFLWIQIAKGIMLLIFLSFGYYLVKSVIREIYQKEQLQKLAEKLEIANTELKRLDKAKSEFVSIASHQLRTPLTAIKGYISMIIEGSYGPLSSKIKRKMENVFESNERLIRLVNDLLNISRIEAGKVELEPEMTNLLDLAYEVVGELKIIAQNKKLYLRIKKPKGAFPKVFIDEDKIRQVILNIVDNAIKYTNQGGITIEFKLFKDKVLVKIKDTGEGLTQEEISKMFESFSRGRAGRDFFVEGAGLGLFISRKFTEMHHGRVWVESEGKSKGSCFYLELPTKE